MLKKTLKALVTGLLAIVLWQQALYVTNEPVTFGWDRGTEGTAPETYEVVAVWEGASGPKQEFNLGVTPDTQMVISRPRTGVFFFKVRAKGEGGETSEWAVSTNPAHATVDGVPAGWRVLFELPAPGGGGIS